MKHKKLAVAVTALGLVGAGSGAALAAKSAPKSVNIKAVQTMKVKINRYIQDGLRWQKDSYRVRAGGTVRVTQLAPAEGPHTLSIVKKRDLPKTVKQINNCKVCMAIAQQHGANPESEAPPQFPFVENGTGQATPPTLDRPGDSAFIGPNKGDSVSLKVGAKPGTTLWALCAVHPWMQTKIVVVK